MLDALQLKVSYAQSAKSVTFFMGGVMFFADVQAHDTCITPRHMQHSPYRSVLLALGASCHKTLAIAINDILQKL